MARTPRPLAGPARGPTRLRATRAVVSAGALHTTFARLGVRPGGVLVAQASLGSLGFVLHGIESLRSALERVLGDGTLVVPTFTGDATDPSSWVDPALPASLWNEVRDGMPGFDRERSLPRQMGLLALSVLMDRRSVRSDHPLCSFAAVGPRAEELVADHSLRDPLGPESPIGRARAAGGQVLLIGLDQRKNVALAHAHSCSDVAQVARRRGAFLHVEDGERRWITPDRLVECGDGYGRIEDYLAVRGHVRCDRVGDATVRLMELEPSCSAAEHHIRLRPEAVFCGRPECRQCVR